MSAMALEIIERLDVRLLANLSHNFRSPYEAAFELVDNGLASPLPGQAVRVTIRGDSRVGGTLKVVTRGGTGMGADELREFLHWGKASPGLGLHRYGQGGKAAVGYLGTGLRVRANRHDEDRAYQFEDKDWLSRPDGKLKRFTLHEVGAPMPGVGIVQLEIIGLKKSVTMKKLERELSWRYAPALRKGMLELIVAGKTVDPVPLPVDRRKDFQQTVLVPSLDESGQTMTAELKGWVGIAPQKFDGRGGVRCSAFGRVVEENEYFGHRTSAYKASLNSLVGEVDMWFVPVLLNKTGFDTASPAWQATQAILYQEMEPFVDQLLRKKDAIEPSDEERLRAMAARDIAGRALEKLAAESSRLGLSGTQEGRKPPEPREGERPENAPEVIPTRTAPQPRTPPPVNPVGRLARTGRSVDWDVRALDPKVRSTADEENGRIEIIINNQFPLYKERAGDLLYMLETGLFEELKPGPDEDKTLEEYTQQVTEAIYLAATEDLGMDRGRGRGRRLA